MERSNHSGVLVVGGGCAGISVATRLKNLKPELKVSIIEPGDFAYYQAAWTLVGAGAYDRDATIRPMKDVMPSNVNWIKAKAESFKPESNTVVTSEGEQTYDYLVVCPGLKINFAGIEGLEQTLGKNNVCTNYSADHVAYTW